MTIRKWFLKVGNLLLISALVLIALSITYIWGSFSDTFILSALTFISSLITTIFLLLTIKEYQKTNRIMMYQHLHQKFSSQISMFYIQKNKHIFNKEESKVLTEYLEFSSNPQYDIAHFILYDLVNEIIDNSAYREALELIKTEDSVEISENFFEKSKNIFLAIETAEYGIHRLREYYKNLRDLYERIYTSRIEPELKIVLYDDLESLSNGYLSFCLPIIRKEKYFFSDYKIFYDAFVANSYTVWKHGGKYHLLKKNKFYDDYFFNYGIQINEYISKLNKT